MIVIKSEINNTKLIFNGRWCLQSDDPALNVNSKILDINSQIIESRLTLILFLELDKEKIFNSIEEQGVRDSFPLKEIIKAGFLMDSKYWTSLAVEWLSNEDTLTCSHFINDLEKIINDKKYSQKIRHKAMKIVAKIRTLSDHLIPP